jgi:diguanylate cyclase (GGDEF)-like protein
MANGYTGAQLSEETMELLDSMPGGIFVFRTGEEALKDIVYINHTMLGFLEIDDGKSFEDLDEKTLHSLVLAEDYPRLMVLLESMKEDPGKTEHIIFRVCTVHGLVRMLQAFCRTVNDSSAGELVCMFATDLGIQSTAGVDPVMDQTTGLMGMRPFLNVMNAYRREHNSRGRRGSLVVLYYDIVDFRLINRSCGLSAGDDFLRSMGRILRDLFPEYAIAHFDADHFAVLCSKEDAEPRAERSRRLIAEIIPELHVNIRVGACIWQDPALEAERACSQAKLACDSVRHGVSDWFVWYADDMGKRMEISEYVTSHVEEAVEKGWIQIFYQPVIRVLSEQVCSFEALARWNDPVFGMLAPSDFIEPLENMRKITILDLEVVRLVCRHQAERFKNGEPLVPVSVNLSRIDFFTCDIFKETDKILHEYNVPRNLLVIEITESVLASDERNIRNALSRFREAGYEIWMDDFGHAYSTLSLLKDYRFDVLKIDLAFLKKDNRRSRAIISSIIEMDKRIGNRTLAEGVETKDQFEFLKAAGCDKVQGYYFGRPLPDGESLSRCLKRGICIETPEWKAYYDSVSSLDFMTDFPMMIVEFRRDRFHFLFVNRRCSELLQNSGFSDPQDAEDSLNSGSAASSMEFRRLAAKAAKTGRPGTYYFESSRMEIALHYRVIASCEDRTMFSAELTNISKENRSIDERAWVLQNIRYFYDDLYVIDIEKREILSVMETGDPEDAAPVSFDAHNRELYSYLPNIFPADRNRYREFIDPDTLQERVSSCRSGVLVGCFRCKETDGSYIWKVHRILLVPHEKKRALLYAVLALDKSSANKIAAKLNCENPSSHSGHEDTESAFWKDFVQQSPVPLFWKDEDRRFLGASRSFLDYYGFENEDCIIGKTDEDMHWHPDNAPYRDDELDVIRNDERRILVPGKCIARGVTHNILATKWPYYRDGRVAGLMGFFLDEDMLNRITSTNAESSTIDPVTGVENLHGILEDFSSFMKDFRIHGTPFAVIVVNIVSLSREIETYGEKYGNAILKACAERITDIVMSSGAVARFSADHFIVICKFSEPEEVRRTSARIRNALEDIHIVEGRKCTVFARTRFLFAEDTSDFINELFLVIREGRNSGGKDKILPGFDSRSNLLRSFFEEVPFGVCILRENRRLRKARMAIRWFFRYSPAGKAGFSCDRKWQSRSILW